MSWDRNVSHHKEYLLQLLTFCGSCYCDMGLRALRPVLEGDLGTSGTLRHRSICGLGFCRKIHTSSARYVNLHP